MPVTEDAATSSRARGWTARRRHRFLAMLAAGHTISFACASVGLSREAAYKARRRDPSFAVGWTEARATARCTLNQAFLEHLPDNLRVRLLEEPGLA